MSKLLTFSRGIYKTRELPKLLNSEVFLVKPFSFPGQKPDNDNVVVGWGKKANTERARNFADENNLPYWSLEDGFISYLGHPALGDRRFSLIVDKTGIYYDATQPSDIEHLLSHPDEWMTAELEARSAELLRVICQHQITKYNHEPVSSWKPETEGQTRVLVVDQTYGDCSVKYGIADDSSFKAMLEAALSENPDSEVWVKVHPDVVLGKKKGYFELEKCGQKIKGFDNHRIKVLADKVNAQSLFPHFDKVYVVTSQLGFEALWYHKEVVCFGVPFYSNWGLTDDRIPCPRRTQKHSIKSLFAAACLKYTRYIDPETGERCELEDIVDLIALQRQYQQREVNTLFLVGFSLWKQAFLKDFLGSIAKSYKFVRTSEKASQLAVAGDGILIWGAGHYDFAPPQGVKLYRCEDAFIRGAGLGAELKRPQSLIIDSRGLYFDCSRPSDLEHAINTIQLSAQQVERGSELRRQLLSQRVSKYNLSGACDNIFSAAGKGQKKLLVTGQVDSDASIKFGSPQIRSNLDLLQKVRKFAPDAYIVYKPHPDVLIAGRTGHIPEYDVLQWADSLTTDSDIFDCISQCDEMHVMTSLAGFEGLLQDKVVHTWGCPFYSSWGLTVDHYHCERREANRTVDELVFFAYDYYSRYVNWNTRRFTSPFRVINSLTKVDQQEEYGNRFSRWVARKKRKVEYLSEALFR